MEKFLNLIKNKQIMACVAIGLLLIATLAFLFSTSPKENYANVEQEIFEFSNNIRNHYKLKPDYWGLNNENVIKNSLAPKQLVRNKKIMSSIGREYIIGQNENGDTVMPSQRNFMLTLDNLSKKACKKIATLKIANENHFGLQKVIIGNNSGIHEFEWGSDNPLPVSKEDADKNCENKNRISWVFE